MGNVQVLSQNTNNGELTEFQKNKLMFDFNTFFDLNNDGYLSYKVNKKTLWARFHLFTAFFVCQDFQWAKDRICQMSGWKMNCAKYKATEKLFTDIWTSLVQVADTDHDGKITRYDIELIVKSIEICNSAMNGWLCGRPTKSISLTKRRRPRTF